MSSMHDTPEVTVSRPRLAVGVVAGLAVLKLAIHLATTGRFGYELFVDELYFLACSENLAWGFVDMPPLFPALTALVRATLGDSLLAIRLVPALAGAALVAMAAAVARDLGGGRFAQTVAGLGILVAPIFLVVHSMHTMNALDPLLWTGCSWILIRILQGGDERLWLAFGAVAGVGLLNKHGMAFWGVALVAGLLATPARRHLARRWIWLGGLVALGLFLPNLVWLAANGFPHFEMLANVAAAGRNVELGAGELLLQQVLMHNPAVPVWIAGLAWVLGSREGRPYRLLGVAWIALMAEMVLLDGRAYYPAPAYPVLLAAGAVALERLSTEGAWRRWARPAFVTWAVGAGLLVAPAWLPMLPPESFIRYARTTGITQVRIENHRLGALPQLFADRFGWREMAGEVARVYHALPPEDRSRAAIFGQNYGQAGAIDHYGPALGLPKAISGHLAYHDWGPRGATGEVVIVLDDDRETLETLFETVELAGRVEHPWSMPYQSFDVWVCRDLKVPISELWPRIRNLG